MQAVLVRITIDTKETREQMTKKKKNDARFERIGFALIFPNSRATRAMALSSNLHPQQYKISRHRTILKTRRGRHNETCLV